MATKFEERAVRRQDEAYKSGYAKFQFEKTCDMCCTFNLRSGRGSCATCPIKEAHIRALKEIASGERSCPDDGRMVYRSKFGHQTQVCRW